MWFSMLSLSRLVFHLDENVPKFFVSLPFMCVDLQNVLVKIKKDRRISAPVCEAANTDRLLTQNPGESVELIFLTCSFPVPICLHPEHPRILAPGLY